MTDTNELFLITGATGNTGAHTVRLLRERGLRVRALVHTLDDRAARLGELGAEVVQGDLLDFPSVSAATAGVTAAYFNYPVAPGLVEATANFVQAASEAGVHAVVVGAQDLGIRHLRAHEAVLDHAPLAGAQHELDADHGIEDVGRVVPRVDRALPPPGGLLPHGRRADRREVEADRGQGLSFGQRKDPVAEVGLGMTLAEVRVQVDGEEISIGAVQLALEPECPAPSGEVDGGREGKDAGHQVAARITDAAPR